MAPRFVVVAHHPAPSFVSARRDLARRLKADGQRARADEVAKLRRPPVTAWALDQVSRNHPEVIVRAAPGDDELDARATAES